GDFMVSNSNTKTVVDWVSTLESVPPDRRYTISIEPHIEDLVGNSLFKETGDTGDVKLLAYRTKDAEVFELPPIVENFNGVLFRDDLATSADWADSVAGLLLNGPGGGTGEDGVFAPT